MEAGAGVRNPRSTEPGSTFAVIYCSKWDDMRHVRQTKNRRWEGVQRPWLNSPLKACMMYQFHVVVFVSYYEQFRARAMFNACLCTCAAAYFAAKAFRADLLESVNALYSSILQRRSLDELPEGPSIAWTMNLQETFGTDQWQTMFDVVETEGFRLATFRQQSMSLGC